MIYKDMAVWQKAMELGVEIYNLTKKFPKAEQFCLINQIRCAAVSIVSNIAEGQGRLSSKNYLHFLSVARGSKSEVDTQLLLAQRLGYITEEDTRKAFQLLEDTGRLLN